MFVDPELIQSSLGWWPKQSVKRRKTFYFACFRLIFLLGLVICSFINWFCPFTGTADKNTFWFLTDFVTVFHMNLKLFTVVTSWSVKVFLDKLDFCALICCSNFWVYFLDCKTNEKKAIQRNPTKVFINKAVKLTNISLFPAVKNRSIVCDVTQLYKGDKI